MLETMLITIRGNVAVHDRAIVVDNSDDGFELYQLDNCEFIRTFTVARYSDRRPKGIAFGERGRVVIGGTEKADVCIFDKNSGTLLDTLNHGGDNMIHTIAVRLACVVVIWWHTHTFPVH
jgi:hypothetical protein